MPPVGLQLGLAGAAGADAAAQPREALAHAGQAGQQVLILRQLDLKPPLPGAGALGKDVENQRAAIQHCHAGGLLQRTNLRGRELVVEDNHLRLEILRQLVELLRLALAEEGVAVRGAAVLQHPRHADRARRLGQRLKLVQRGLGGVFRRRKDVGAQSGQNHALAAPRLLLFHRFSYSVEMC